MKMIKYPAIVFMLLGMQLGANAADYILFEDWSDCPDGALPSDWTTIGTNKTPSGYSVSHFEYGDGFKVMELPGSTLPYAVSYSTTLEGGKVDTRLISPTFTVPAAGAILSFNAVNYNPEGTSVNKIEVFAEDEEGTRESLLVTRVPSNNVTNPSTYNLSLEAFAGKEIRLVIANEGTTAGLLGIGSIMAAEYVGEIQDSTPLFTSNEES